MWRLFLPILLCFICGPVYSGTNGTIDNVLSVGKSKITVHMPAETTKSQQVKITRWIQHTAQSAIQLYGSLPLARFGVNIQFSDRAKEPVPWGKVSRKARHPVVEFLINPDFSLQSFTSDWTATHEFSHLFLPYPGERHIWFSEGLASYYQNVLMARGGTFTPQRAWQKLYAGFRRGLNDTRMDHLTLEQLSPKMWSSGSYMRVYWSGAAYFLNVDVLLRTRSKNPSSVDQALYKFRECCLSKNRKWTLQQLLVKLDQQVGGDVFQQVYRQCVHSKSLLDLTAVNTLLGIVDADGKLSFSRENTLRQAIMAPNFAAD